MHFVIGSALTQKHDAGVVNKLLSSLSSNSTIGQNEKKSCHKNREYTYAHLGHAHDLVIFNVRHLINLLTPKPLAQYNAVTRRTCL